MKILIVVLCAVATGFVAGAQSAKKPSAKKPEAARQIQSLEIPANAVKAADGSYHYTDPKGKKWIYYKTVFGVSRTEDKPAAEMPKVDDTVNITAREDGDTIHFERPTPFGAHKWERKKSDLDATEKAVWERERAKSGRQEKQE